jgi:hypothetical protein
MKQFKINVPTRNRFSVLNTLNREPNEFDKKQQNKQNEVDALIITDSHGRDLDESKLYKYRKVKLHVLAKGKMNIHGAYEYNEESDTGADPGFVVRVGVSMRGVWGPRPQRGQGRALVGGPGGVAPRRLWGFEELQTFI